MTDAYEDVFASQEKVHDGEVTAAEGRGNDSFTQHEKALNHSGSEQPGGQLEAAEQRRKEFRAWLLHRARHSSGGTQKAAERGSLEERRIRRLERLQERLAAAEANRAACLARLQSRAAATSQRREGAAERAAAAAAERVSAAAERLETDLAAAESRRLALREAELERLRAEHELVLSRLVSSQERAASGAEQQRSRLEARLRSAASEREARLARRVAKAASKVERARALGAQTREMQQQEIEQRRQALEQKLETARMRREGRRVQAGTVPNAGGAGGAPEELDITSSASSPSTSSQSLRFQTHSPSPSRSVSSSQSQSESSSPLLSPHRKVATPTAATATIGFHSLVSSAAVTPVEFVKGSGGIGDSKSDATIASKPLTDALIIAVPEAVVPLAKDESGTAAADNAPKVDADADTEVSSRLEGLRRSMSSRRLQQVWRAFVQSKRTTRTLAEAFVAQGITNVQLPTSPAPSPTAAAAEDAAARAAGAVDVACRHGLGRSAPVVIGLGTSSGSAAAAALARLGAQGGGISAGRAAGGDGGDGFDRFASALRSPATLKATQALMRRLEQRLAARLEGSKSHGSHHSTQASQAQGHGSPSLSHSQGQSAAATSVSRLLRRLYPTAPRDAKLERYPPRVLLCAFMIVKHPEVVFSGSGSRESALAAAARDLVDRFEALLERIIVVPAEPPSAAAAEPAGPVLHSPAYPVAASPVARGMEELLRQRRATAVLGGGLGLPPSPSSSSPYMTIGSLLVQFDDAWLRYLDQFVTWKGADAASLEAELVRCAAALEASMLRKCRGNITSERVRRSSDLQAVIAQVAHDQTLLRERISKLGGEAGLARLEAALEAARRAVAAEIAEHSGSGSPSAATSEADTTDAEGPARHSRGGGSVSARRVSASSSPVMSRQRTPPTPLALPLEAPPVASPSSTANVGAADVTIATRPPASPPIAAPPRRSENTYADASNGGAAGGTTADGHGASGVLPSPLSASPRSPGSLRASLLGPGGGGIDGGSGGGGTLHAPLPLDAVLISNAALVHEILLGASTGSYRIPISDAEAAWSRAVAAMSQEAGGLAVLPPGPGLEELRAMNQEQLIQALRSRTAAIAECAFWDNVIATLAAALRPWQLSLPSGATSSRGTPVSRLATVLAPLLSEVAYEVASVVNSPQQASAVRAEFGEAVIRGKIEGEAAQTSSTDSAGCTVGSTVAAIQRALGVLQRLAGLLVAAGAPAREEAALAAQDTMRQRLGTAVQEYAQHLSSNPSMPSRLVGGDPDEVDFSDSSGASDEGEGAAGLPPPPPPLAAALGRALRLLAAQVKLLKVDAANGRLLALAARLQVSGGVDYLRSRFIAIFRLDGVGAATATAAAATGSASGSNADASSSLPPAEQRLRGSQLLQALPRTTAWLQRSRAAAGNFSSYIRAQGIDMAAAVSAAAASNSLGTPLSIRAGLRLPPGSGSGSGSALANPAAGAARAPPVPPVVPVGPDGGSSSGAGDNAAAAAWRWVVRCGLVGLVSSDSPAMGPSLAETLLWDGERLHAAQNQFQQLVVVTAGLLLVTQLRATATAAARAAAPDAAAAAAAASIAAAAWGPEARAAAARRMLVVVADPGMRLPDLTSELAAMAGVAGDAEAEARLRVAFMSLVEPGSGAFRSITNALAAALLMHIAIGPPVTHGSPAPSAAVTAGSGGGGSGGVAAAASAALLSRVGASGLAADVAALGEQLLALCAVNEAVHGDLYEEMHGQIVEEGTVATASSSMDAQQAAAPATVSDGGLGDRGRLKDEEEKEEEDRLSEGDEI